MRRSAITTAAKAIALELKALGSTHFFLVTGGDNSLWIALREEGIRQVLARSEASAVYMADAYARLTGRPTFTYGQYGPGAANVSAALAEPLWSSSPVVAMPTSMRRQHRYRHEYQELEQVLIFAGFTKWQAEPQIPAQVPHAVRLAARQALAAPTGPVYLGFPSDILELEIEGYQPPAGPTDLRLPLGRPQPPAGLVEDAARVLSRAKRPVVIAGNGVHQSRAEAALFEVVKALRLPVVTSLSGKGSIPETHELSFGTVGRYSRNYANKIVKEADAILAIGCRLGGLVTDSYRLVPPGAQIVHVDLDAAAIGFNFPVTVGVNADAGAFLDQLAQLMASGGAPGPGDDRQAYLADLVGRRNAWEAQRRQLAAADGTDGKEMRPEAVLDIVNTLAPADTVVVADTGYAAAWAGALYNVRDAGQGFLRADGSLGWAFPAALGAKLAAPDKAIVCITGDGGFGYHIGELETARRLGIPVVVVVLDNRALAFEVHVQELLYKEVVGEVDDFADTDYAAVARAFGVPGVRVSTGPEFSAAFEKALHSDQVTVIDALTAQDAIGPVTRYDSVRERAI